MASVGREKKIGLTPTGHSERKSKFCDNEIPSPAVPRYAFDRRRQDPLSQNRRRRNLVGDQNYSAAPYNDYRKSLRIPALRAVFLLAGKSFYLGFDCLEETICDKLHTEVTGMIELTVGILACTNIVHRDKGIAIFFGYRLFLGIKYGADIEALGNIDLGFSVI